jgi:insertion element IS1 protein InsB
VKATKERISLRGLARILGVSRKAITTWLREAIRALPPFQSSVSASQLGDILKLDEGWSFVANKKQKVWLWLALCRRTRQSVAYTLGDRSTHTCQELYNKLPEQYRHCKTYSDFWDAYQAVFPKDTYQTLGKEAGQTNRIILNVGTTPCVSARLGMFVKPCLSPSL